MTREIVRLVCCALLTGIASAQAIQSPPGRTTTPAKDKIAQAMDALKRGDLAEADITYL